ncbi:hypothetical protein BT69DRAFT_1333165 [Atractiella rhizophila]|nr:hypothetical protein BT69DRAFT_1333165 [Atractiella rhizophila]
MENYYASSPLNRLSWLRTSKSYLSSALSNPSALFLPFNDRLEVLCTKDGSTGAPSLAFVKLGQIKAALSQERKTMEGVDGKEWETQKRGEEGLEEERNEPILVFLGVEEEGETLPEKEREPDGRPIWAIQLAAPAPGAKEETKEKLSKIREELVQGGREWTDLRIGGKPIQWDWAGVFATARHMIDWNARNRYCPSCGRATRSVWAGWKRACIPDSPVPGVEGRTPCVSSKQVHNFSYPRTDPVVIMAVLSPDREKILLGRQKTWPAKFYSCLAGFFEPGESLENAVRREVKEEAGIKVDQVLYHSSQPWPYPSSLMIGCLAVASANSSTPRVDLDNELEDARWVDRKALVEILSKKEQSGFSRQELDRIQAASQGEATGQEGEEKKKLVESDIRLPPPTAIAHQLIKAWAMGDVLLPPPGVGKAKV